MLQKLPLTLLVAGITRQFALTPAGGRSRMQPMAKILLSHPHPLSPFAQSLNES
jgi:hypothetical protein